MSLKLQLLSESGGQWVQWCKNKLAALTTIRQKSGLVTLVKYYSFSDNTTAQIISSRLGDVIRIWGSAAGFICHPRSTTYPGGISSEDGTAIVAVYTYPLIDDDHGSTILTPLDWNLSTDVENYGNVDWLDKDGVATSWRGPSSRSFAMDSLSQYSGFTVFDYEAGGFLSVPHYTPYQKLVYQGGEVYLTFPDGYKVLGSNDKYTIVGVDYTGRTNPDAGVGGFYTEVWEGLSTRIGFLHDSRPTVPWFFNQSGSQAVSAGKKVDIVISEDVSTAIFGILPSGSGIETKSIVPNQNWSLSRNGLWEMYHDYAGDVLSNINLNVLSSDYSSKTGGGSDEYTALEVRYCGTGIATVTVTIVGNQASATITGEYCPCTTFGVWSISNGGSITQGGVINKAVGCGLATVTYTCGSLSGTAQVKLNTGAWIRTECLRDPAMDAFFYNSYGGGSGDTYWRQEYWDIKGGDLGLESTWFCYWTDGPPAGCYICGWSGAHYKGCRGDLIPVTGYSAYCTSLNDDVHGCYFFPIWACFCYGCNKKVTYTWGCAGDSEVPDC